MTALPDRQSRLPGILGTGPEEHPAGRLLRDVGDDPQPRGSLEQRVGSVATGAAGLAAALLAHLADGVLTAEERADLAGRLDRAEADVRAARALLNGGGR